MSSSRICRWYVPRARPSLARARSERAAARRPSRDECVLIVMRTVCDPAAVTWQVDEFTNPKKGKTSHCYRITYRSMDRSLTDDEVNEMQFNLRDKAEAELGVELR